MAIGRSLTTFNADGSAVVNPSRTDGDLAAFTAPIGAGKMSAYANEGSYFTTYNVTDGTGIIGHAAPVQSDLSLKPLLQLYNGNTSASGKRVILDFIRLRMTAIGAGASTTDFTVWVDQSSATARSSGGTLATPVNVRSDNPLTAGAVVYFGAVVAVTAPSSERRLDHQRVRSTVAVVEDQYFFSFGHTGYGPPTGGITMAGTAVLGAFVHLPPVVIVPGGNFKLQQWGTSQSGAHSFEYTLGWIER